MGKANARIAFHSLFLLVLLSVKVTGRYLHYDGTEKVSDGLKDSVDQEAASFLRLKEMDYSEESCEQMYGFLPCSTNLPGHLFLIVVYEYLLYHGESYAGGDGRIFGVLGNNFFGASVFQLLDSLPDSLILLASGLSSSKEKAQDYVVTGVGLLAGSSILLLTVLWGFCLIFGRRKFYIKPGSKENKSGIQQLLTGSGVLTDAETSYHAKVMFFSLIPFIIIPIPRVFGEPYSSKEYNIVVLFSLIVAVLCLISYFYYQRFDPRIQNRRLDYAEVERKVEMQVPFYDVQNLMLDRDKHLMLRQKDMEKAIKNHETDEDDMITKEEFYGIFEEWLDVTRQLMDDPYSLDKSGTRYNQVAQLLLEERNKLMELVSIMMERASGQKLQKQDGTPDESSIDRFFARIDSNKNGFISPSEMKAFIMEVNHEEMVMDEEVVDIIMRHLDIDGNGDLDKEEFKSGVTRWLKEIRRVASRNSQKPSQDGNQKSDGYQRGEAKAKAEAKFKAIALLVVGIFMLTVLAEPLIESVRNFSESIQIQPFYVSFILVPLATNARTAIAAIRAANQKRHHTTSLTFSEIYHKVFMNNVLGFCVLVSVIYFRGLTWHFSAEVLVVVIVCMVMGLLASFRSKFPNWTLLVAFPLYPLSLVLVYLLDDTYH